MPQGGGAATQRYYLTDAQGSVAALEDASGQIAANERYSYDPYGALKDDDVNPQTDPEDDLGARAKANPFRFQGFYYDSHTQSYDMQARAYRPEIGRFLSQDRFADAGADLELQTDPLTQNRYVFAGGNPVSIVEWDGHCANTDAGASWCHAAGSTTQLIDGTVETPSGVDLALHRRDDRRDGAAAPGAPTAGAGTPEGTRYARRAGPCGGRRPGCEGRAAQGSRRCVQVRSVPAARRIDDQRGRGSAPLQRLGRRDQRSAAGEFR